MGESVFSYKILNRPDFAFLYVQIPLGQTLKVEASAMATMTPNLKMKTKMTMKLMKTKKKIKMKKKLMSKSLLG